MKKNNTSVVKKTGILSIGITLVCMCVLAVSIFYMILKDNYVNFSENANMENVTKSKKRSRKPAAETGQMTLTAMFGI